MKEAIYLAMLSKDVEIEIGGKVIKISDKSTLGLPDSMHIKDGVVTYIEAKIVEPTLTEDLWDSVWKRIKKDTRQFEVCKSLAIHSLVLYCLYYPKQKRSVVITTESVDALRENPECCILNAVAEGRGILQIKALQNQYRRSIYDRIGKTLT